MRMEPGPGKDKYDHARLSQHVALKPGRLYRATAWFRVEGLPTWRGHLRMQIYMDKTDQNAGANAAKVIYHLKDEDGWQKVTLDFASRESAGARSSCWAACGFTGLSV